MSSWLGPPLNKTRITDFARVADSVAAARPCIGNPEATTPAAAAPSSLRRLIRNCGVSISSTSSREREQRFRDHLPGNVSAKYAGRFNRRQSDFWKTRPKASSNERIPRFDDGASTRGEFAAAEQQPHQTIRRRISGDSHSSLFTIATIAICITGSRSAVSGTQRSTRTAFS